MEELLERTFRKPMCNELTNDTQSSRNMHFIMSTYAQFVSLSSNHALTGILQHYRLSMQAKAAFEPRFGI